MSTKEIMQAIALLQNKIGRTFQLPHSHPLMTEFDRIRDLMAAERVVSPLETLMEKCQAVKDPERGVNDKTNDRKDPEHVEKTGVGEADEILEAIRANRNKAR